MNPNLLRQQARMGALHSQYLQKVAPILNALALASIPLSFFRYAPGAGAKAAGAMADTKLYSALAQMSGLASLLAFTTREPLRHFRAGMLKEMAPRLGAAGRVERSTNVFFRTLSLAALPATIAQLAGAKFTLPSLHKIFYGSMWPIGYGMIGANILASLVRSRKMAAILPTPITASEAERRYSKSQGLRSVLAKYRAANAITPGEALLAQLLGLIEAHTSVLPYLFEKKEKGEADTAAAGLDLDKKESGLVDTILDRIEFAFSKIGKYDPLGQIFTFLFTGKTPRAVQKEMERLYGPKETQEEKEERLGKGLSFQQHRLLKTPGAQIAERGLGYEGKMIALQIAIYDVLRFSLAELTTIRVQGHDLKEQVVKPPEDKTVLQKLFRMLTAPARAVAGIPGLNAIFNLLGLAYQVSQVPFRMARGVRPLFERMRGFFTGGIEEYIRQPRKLLEGAGIYKSPQEKAFDAMAHAVPEALEAIRAIGMEQLEVQQNIYQVQSDMLASLTGISHVYEEFQKAGKEKRIWSVIAGQYLSRQAFEQEQQLIKDRIDLFLQQRFKRTPLGDLFTFLLGRGARDREKAALEKILDTFLRAEKRLFGYTDLLEKQLTVDAQGKLRPAETPLESLVGMALRRATRPKYGLPIRGREFRKLQMEMEEPFFYLRARLKSAAGALGGLLGFPVGGHAAAGAGFGLGFREAFRFFTETQRRLFESLRQDYEARRQIRQEIARLQEVTGPIPVTPGAKREVPRAATVPGILSAILAFLRSLVRPAGPSVNVRLASGIPEFASMTEAYEKKLEELAQGVRELQETSQASAEAAAVSANNLIILRRRMDKPKTVSPETLAKKYEEAAGKRERREMLSLMKKLGALMPVPSKEKPIVAPKEDLWSVLTSKLFKFGTLGLVGMSLKNIFGQMFADIPFLGALLGGREFKGVGEKLGGVLGMTIGSILGLWLFPFFGPLGGLLGAVALGPLGGKLGSMLQETVESRFGKITWTWDEKDPNSVRNVVKDVIYKTSPVTARLLYEQKLSFGALIGGLIGMSLLRVPLPLGMLLGAVLGAEAGEAVQRRFDPGKILGDFTLSLDTQEPASIARFFSGVGQQIQSLIAPLLGQGPVRPENLGGLVAAVLGLRWLGPYLGFTGAIVGALLFSRVGEMLVTATRNKLSALTGGLIEAKPVTDQEALVMRHLGALPGIGLFFREGGGGDLVKAGLGAALGLGLYFVTPALKVLGPIGSALLGMTVSEMAGNELVTRITGVFEALKESAGLGRAGITTTSILGLGMLAPGVLKAAVRSVPVLGAALSVIFDVIEGKTDLGQIIGGAAGSAVGAVVGQLLIPIPVVGAVLGALVLGGVGRWIGEKVSNLLTWQTEGGGTFKLLDLPTAINQLLSSLKQGLTVDNLVPYLAGAGAGGAVGALIGQFLIPVPLIGAGVGAILGAGVGTLFHEQMRSLYEKAKNLLTPFTTQESFRDALAELIRKIPGLENYQPSMTLGDLFRQGGIGAGVGALVGKVLFGPILGLETGGMLGALIFGAAGNLIWQTGKKIIDAVKSVPSAILGQPTQVTPPGPITPEMFEAPVPIGGPPDQGGRVAKIVRRPPVRGLFTGGPDEAAEDIVTPTAPAAAATAPPATSGSSGAGILERFAYEIGYGLGSLIGLATGKGPGTYAPPPGPQLSLGGIFSGLFSSTPGTGTGWFGWGAGGKGIGTPNRASAGRIMEFLVAQGFTPEQAAGILGNLAHESKLNPEASGDRGTSYGLAQWHAERWENLKRFANAQGKPMSDPETQLRFLVHELNTTEQEALRALKETRTPEDAALVFARKFERPAAHINLSPRATTARKYLELYQKGLLKAEMGLAEATAEVAGFKTGIPQIAAQAPDTSYQVQMFPSAVSGTVPPLAPGYVITDYPRWRSATRRHRGYDMVGKAGDPVYAVAPGRVVFAGQAAGYDNLVMLHHPQIHPMLQTRYAHLQAPHLVSVGQDVMAGQVIGRVGATDAPHLHVEARLAQAPEVAGKTDPVVDLASMIPNFYAAASSIRGTQPTTAIGGPDMDVRTGRTLDVERLKRDVEEVALMAAPVAMETLQVLPAIVGAANNAAREAIKEHAPQVKETVESLVDNDMRDIIRDLFSRATTVWKREYEGYAYRNLGIIDV